MKDNESAKNQDNSGSTSKADNAKGAIDSANLKKLQKSSQALKNQKMRLELKQRIALNTKSAKPRMIIGCTMNILTLFSITYFKGRGQLVINSINLADVPLIEAQGELAAIPAKSLLPPPLKALDQAYYTNTPKSKYLPGAAEAVTIQKNNVEKFRLPLEISNEIGMNFRLIPKGEFLMGSPVDEAHRQDSEYIHQQTIGAPFYVGKYEVTVKQWKEIVGSLPFNSVTKDNLPVTGASLNDCLKFIRLLNEKHANKSHYSYYILSEREWEYSCRAGCSAAYSFGPEVAYESYATTRNSTRSKSFEAVGLRRPNAWGLYDMHGNAAEWTITPYFLYACSGAMQYAGITTRQANALQKRAIDDSEKHFEYLAPNSKNVLSVNEILFLKSWDRPIYDGTVPVNIISPLKNFDVPVRAFGSNFDLCYYDKNGNNEYDKYETIWKDSLEKGIEKRFDAEHDTIILTYTAELPPEGSVGHQNNLYYYDKNQDFQWDATESVWSHNPKARKGKRSYVFRGGAYLNSR